MHERHRLLQAYGWAGHAVLTVPNDEPPETIAATESEKKAPR